jgi:hypothetical protein
MGGDRGQSARVVVSVAVDVVVAVADYRAGGAGKDSSTIPGDHRMPDPENGIRAARGKSDRVVAGNDIAQHDYGRQRKDAGVGSVVGSLAIDDGDVKRCPGRQPAIHFDSAGTIIVRRDVAEHAGDDSRSHGLDNDARTVTVIGSNRIRHREVARRGGHDSDPVFREIPDDAVLDGEVSARGELDAVLSAAESLDGQAAQVDVVARAGIDGDAIRKTCGLHARDAGAVVDDADRFIDGHRAIAGRVEHVDLGAGGGLGERKSKSPARRSARARAAVGSRSGNPSPVWPRLRWDGGKATDEESPGDGSQCCDLDHGMSSQATRNSVAGAAYTAGK